MGKLFNPRSLAFFNYGVTEDDGVDTDGDGTPDIQEAMNYILGRVQGDGGIYQGAVNYETSIGILALVAADQTNVPHKYTNIIEGAKDFLLSIQNVEGVQPNTFSNYTGQIAQVQDFLSSIENDVPTWQTTEAQSFLSGIQNVSVDGEISPDNPNYGGWGYSWADPNWADLSNTQWSLMGLHAAYSYLGLAKPDPNTPGTWTSKAVKYLERCQNYTTNDQAWAGIDGGLIYMPGYSQRAGGTTSSGGMTYAGIWSMLLAGLNVADPRVQAALDWAENNYSVTDNPPVGDWCLYYYYISMAKALAMTGQVEINGHGWFEELSVELLNAQYPEGYWYNPNPRMEDEKPLATAYALLSLQTQTLPPGVNLWMSIILASNADLHIYDPQGRHVGMNYDTGQMDMEIPGATSEVDAQGRHIVNLEQLQAGVYRIELVGTGDGDYTLTVEGYRDETLVSSEDFPNTIHQGETHVTDAVVSSITGALTIYVEEPTLVPGGLVATPRDQAIDLDWSPIIDPEILGYKVHYGIASRSYGPPIDVGNTTSYKLTGLTNDVRYYISVTAYYEAGRESDYSVEVTVTPVEPINPPVLSGMPDVEFVEDGSDSSIDIDDYVDDPDNTDAEITFAYSGNTHVNVAIDPNSHVITFAADTDWSGSEDITFTATDPDGSNDSDTITVTVTPVPEVVEAIYELLKTTLTLKFDMLVKHDEIVFDGIGMDLDGNGIWDIRLPGHIPLHANETEPSKVITINLFYAYPAALNLALAAHLDVGLVLQAGAFTDIYGTTNDALAGTVPVQMLKTVIANQTLNFSRGLNLMSFPGNPTISDFATLFQEPIAAGIMNPEIFAWNGDTQSFEIASTCEFGKGYWVQTLESYSVNIEYQSVSSLTSLLKPNWELLGSVSESVAWTDRNCEPSTVVHPTLFGWDAGAQSFVAAAKMEPGHGYYTNQTGNSILTIKHSSESASSDTQVESVVKATPTWEGAVLVKSGSHSQELLFGVHPAASSGFDRLLDMPIPPIPAMSVIPAIAVDDGDLRRRRRRSRPNEGKRRSSISSEEGILKAGWMTEDFDSLLLSTSYVGDNAPLVWKLFVDLPSDGELEFRGLPSGYEGLLLEEGEQPEKVWPRHDRSRPVRLSAGEHELTLVLEAIPKKTRMLANYPNPFNPETWIPYRLAEDSDVLLIISSISGREVRRLHLGNQSAGNYLDKSRAIYWDGRNESGESVSSGVYFYSLKADGVIQTGKLVIIR